MRQRWRCQRDVDGEFHGTGCLSPAVATKTSTLAAQVRGWRRATTRQATVLERIGRPIRW